MKNEKLGIIKLRKLFLFISVSLFFLFIGCPDGLQTPIVDSVPEGMGIVRITIGGQSARTILPSQVGINAQSLYYTLIFTSQDDGVQFIEIINQEIVTEVIIPLGTWNMELFGFINENDSNNTANAIVYGEETDIVVTIDGFTAIEVDIFRNEKAMLSRGTGTLSYDITIPAETEGTFTVYELDGTKVGESILLEVLQNAGEIGLNSGFYYVSASIEYNDKTAVWRELVHIYFDTETEVIHEFNISDFENSNEGIITSFDIASPLPFKHHYGIDNTTNKIKIYVPPQTDFTAIIPEIIFSGAMITPGLAEQVDFTEPVTYTVYAENGKETTFTVEITDIIDEVDTLTILNGYLASRNRNNPANPIPVKLNIELTTDILDSILSAFELSDKYIDLNISGSIGMEEFSFGNNLSNSGRSYISKIILPDSVTSIGDNTFNNFTWLTNITLGNNITSIGNEAFRNCRGLANITIPDSVTSIGNFAFSGCTGLTSITIPDSVISIGNNAFSNCERLASTVIGNSVTSIGNGAFAYCLSLTSIIIPNSVTSIGERAFFSCISLTSVIIPDSVISIGIYAFNGCLSLTSVVIGSSVKSIGYGAFVNTRFTSITIPDSVTSIGYGAFTNTSLTSITIPDSVISIEGYAFAGCVKLNSIIIPDSVTIIGEGAFYGNTSLTSITIPDSVTIIGAGAFANTSLTSIIIPDSVTSIEYYTFAGCVKLYSIIIPDSVTSIGASAFSDCHNLYSIFIPNSVTIIGAGAFANTSLTSIIIPNSVTSIGNEAFQSCTVLTSIIIPDSVTSIGNGAFAYCYSLTSIIIPNSVTSIGNGAFAYCYSLTSIIIPDSVTSIEDYTFADCYSLTSIIIPNSVTSIGNEAFRNCIRLTSVTFQSIISSANFSTISPFPGDLRTRYLAAGGGIGTYITTNPGSSAVWTKQP